MAIASTANLCVAIQLAEALRQLEKSERWTLEPFNPRRSLALDLLTVRRERLQAELLRDSNFAGAVA